MVRTLVALTAALLLAPASASAALPVGHTVKRITVPGTLPQEVRAVDVHLWYPADAASFAQASTTVYRSALYGDTRIPAGWKPLSWASTPRSPAKPAIAQQGKPYPVIVFSTGNQNDPIDYGYTLELIAAAGFVVAAPSHANNSGDDVRIDFINQQAGTRLIPCNDGLPPRATFGTGDCSKTNVPNSIADRVRDVSYVLNALPGWLGSRVDVAQAGVFGHSRGTLTALTAAGGSTVWGVAPEPRVQAIMGVSIGMQALASQVSLTNVKAPALLVAGALDATSPPSREQVRLRQPSRASTSATSRSRTRTTGPSTRPTATRRSRRGRSPRPTGPGEARQAHVRPDRDPSTSGQTQDYCPYSTFTSPTDVTGLLFDRERLRGHPDQRPDHGPDGRHRQAAGRGSGRRVLRREARARRRRRRQRHRAGDALAHARHRGVVRRVHARRRPYLRREHDRQRDLHGRRRRALGDRSQRALPPAGSSTARSRSPSRSRSAPTAPRSRR